jgi:hypothetical protein
MNPFFTVKRQPTDCPKYRAYVVSIGCIIKDGNCQGGVEPNHFTLTAQGGSDTTCGGLCSFHHQEFHKNPDAFLDKYKVDWDECRTRLLEGFFRQLEIGFDYLPTPQRKQRSRGKNIAKLTKTVNKF